METHSPLLADIAPISGIILLYAFFNILAWGRRGVYIQEIGLLIDMRNERPFNLSVIKSNRLRPILYLQYFIFSGLALFAIARPDIASSPAFQLSDYLTLAVCLAAPVGWFFLHLFFIHWFDYLTGGDSRVMILDRIYKAIHLFAGPVTLFFFGVVASTEFSVFWTSILLTAIFIITQIVFIFSGIKIFYNGFGSICLFFLYLCALEIAPLAVILVKMSH